jgi:hypothetical protein
MSIESIFSSILPCVIRDTSKIIHQPIQLLDLPAQHLLRPIQSSSVTVVSLQYMNRIRYRRKRITQLVKAWPGIRSSGDPGPAARTAVHCRAQLPRGQPGRSPTYGCRIEGSCRWSETQRQDADGSTARHSGKIINESIFKPLGSSSSFIAADGFPGFATDAALPGTNDSPIPLVMTRSIASRHHSHSMVVHVSMHSDCSGSDTDHAASVRASTPRLWEA